MSRPKAGDHDSRCRECLQSFDRERTHITYHIDRGQQCLKSRNRYFKSIDSIGCLGEMAETDRGPFVDLDVAEQERIQGLYAGLREKLLDLTKRNRMLNYSLNARSKRHLQFFDEVPEDIYRLLAVESGQFETLPLPEPEDIPKDEKTEEFLSALAHAKVADIEYLTQAQVDRAVLRA